LHSEPQRVTLRPGVPDAVKFDAGASVWRRWPAGRCCRDLRSGSRTSWRSGPGLDNLTLAGRLFVSNFTGEITEIPAKR
jgi:hypothetical protein